MKRPTLSGSKHKNLEYYIIAETRYPANDEVFNRMEESVRRLAMTQLSDHIMAQVTVIRTAVKAAAYDQILEGSRR